MLSQHTPINNGVSLPALRLILGLTALAISFYYSFKFLSIGTNGFELLSALAFVCITEATKAMYSHDIAYYTATRQGDKTLFAAIIVLILFALSITATVYFLLANPLKEDAKLQNTTHRTEQLKSQIDAKQNQLSLCNANYLTKCVNPRTLELNALQLEYDKALAKEESLSAIQANKAFWNKTAAFVGTNADELQIYFAITRGVLLEIIGLALIAQATANRRLQSVSLDTQGLQSNSNDTRLTDNREKQSVSLGTQDLQSNSNDNRLTDNVVKEKNSRQALMLLTKNVHSKGLSTV